MASWCLTCLKPLADCTCDYHRENTPECPACYGSGRFCPKCDGFGRVVAVPVFPAVEPPQ